MSLSCSDSYMKQESGMGKAAQWVRQPPCAFGPATPLYKAEDVVCGSPAAGAGLPVRLAESMSSRFGKKLYLRPVRWLWANMLAGKPDI